MTNSPPAKRACDACHRRKVRCIGGVGPGLPCRNCSQTSLQCTYNAIPQKKGPKGSRAKVISELRDTQQQTTIAQKVSVEDHTTESNPFEFNSPLTSPTFKRDPSPLTRNTIESCLDFYFEHMYSITPIFDQQKLRSLVESHSSTPEVYCLAAAMCSFIMIQPGMVLPGTPGAQDSTRYGNAEALLQEALNVRKSYDYVASPTLLAVQTDFFLFACYFTLEKQNIAWYHLIQATTLAQMTGMHEESSYLVGDKHENMYRRNTFWLILLTERAYAMERHRPLTLHPTIELPNPEEDQADHAIISGFLHLINLFRHIDDDFIGLWNKTKSECSTTWLAELQQKLTDALPPKLMTTESQAADIYSTQHWLRTMVWQLSIMNGYLSSSSKDSCMTFQYPIEIARDLIRDINSLTQESMELHGVGLIEKLFDIACTLTDVIACVPLNTAIFGTIPADYLNQFLFLISRLRGGASRFVPLLLAKISENIPSLTGLHFMQSDYMNEPSPPVPASATGSSGSMRLDNSQSPVSSYARPQPSTDPNLMYASYAPSASENQKPTDILQGMVPLMLAPVPRGIPRSMPFGQHG